MTRLATALLASALWSGCVAYDHSRDIHYYGGGAVTITLTGDNGPSSATVDGLVADEVALIHGAVTAGDGAADAFLDGCGGAFAVWNQPVGRYADLYNDRIVLDVCADAVSGALGALGLDSPDPLVLSFIVFLGEGCPDYAAGRLTTTVIEFGTDKGELFETEGCARLDEPRPHALSGTSAGHLDWYDMSDPDYVDGVLQPNQVIDYDISWSFDGQTEVVEPYRDSGLTLHPDLSWF